MCWSKFIDPRQEPGLFLKIHQECTFYFCCLKSQVLLSLSLPPGQQNDVLLEILGKIFFDSIQPPPSQCLPLPCQPPLSSPHHGYPHQLQHDVTSWLPASLLAPRPPPPPHHRDYFSKSCLGLTDLGSWANKRWSGSGSTWEIPFTDGFFLFGGKNRDSWMAYIGS